MSLGDTPTAAKPGGAGPGSGADGAAVDSPGTPLSDRYEVLAELGRGGFAVVYSARDRKLDRPVAIKRLLSEGVGGKQAELTLNRFRREARAIAGLNHRNIVQVFDHDRDEHGHYIVMELVAGGSLRDLLKERGKLPVPEAVRLLTGVCQGLAFAHKRSLIHRDVKPGNILLVREGDYFVPKIVDFGLARAGSESDLSVTGYGMGTPAYMPPEQRRDAKSVNHTADLYAVGKTLYEAVTGEPPDDVLPGRIPPPPALSAIIFKCIETRPEDRYFSADDLIRDLEALSSRSGNVVATVATEAAVNACPSCGSSNPEDVKFCEACGTGLSRRCPECDRENSVHKQFCGGCGTDVAGLILIQEALQRIQSYAAERKWSRVTKEFGLLPEKPRLPGPKGKKAIEELRTLNEQAQSAMRKRDDLRQTVQAAVEAGKLEEALDLLPQYQQLDPDNAEVNRLPVELIARIDERDWRSAEEQASAGVREQDFGAASSVYAGYLERHPDGKFAAEARRLCEESLPEAKRTRELVTLDEGFGQAIAGRAFLQARGMANRIRELVATMRRPQEASPLVLGKAGQALTRSPATVLHELGEALAAIDGAEERAARLTSEAATAAAAARLEEAERLLGQADELFPGRPDTTQALARVRQAAALQRATVEAFRADVGRAEGLLAERDLPTCRGLVADLGARRNGLVIAPESTWSGAWQAALSALAEVGRTMEELADREKQAQKLVAHAATAGSSARFEEAEQLLLQAESLFAGLEGTGAALERVREQASAQRQAVADFRNGVARAQGLLDGKDRLACRIVVDELQQRRAALTVAAESTWSGEWTEANRALDELTDRLAAVETELARLRTSAEEAFAAQDYQACIEVCSAARSLSTEKGRCSELEEEARRATETITRSLVEAETYLESGRFRPAAAACQRALALQAGNAHAGSLAARIGTARTSLLRRRVALAIALATLACLAVLASAELRFLNRRRAFEGARAAGQTTEAMRLARLIVQRWPAAAEYIRQAEEANRQKGLADGAWADLRRLNIDPGQGMGARLAAIEAQLASAAAAIGKGQWTEAITACQAVLAGIAEVHTILEQRTTADADRSAATKAWNDLQSRRLDPGQGLDARLKAAAEAYGRAAEAYEGTRWGEAVTGYKAVMAQVTGILDTQTKRQAAAEQRAKSDQARTSAIAGNSEALAAKAVQAAEAEGTRAAALFEKGSFDEARSVWQEAARLWLATEDRAKQVAACRKSRAAFDSAVSALAPAKGDLLTSCGGPVWEDISGQVKAAEATADIDPVAAGAVYDAALAKLPEAFREAECQQVLRQARDAIQLLQTMTKGDVAVLALIQKGTAPLAEFEQTPTWRLLTSSQKDEITARREQMAAFAVQLGIVPGRGQPWTNTLSMEFLPVAETEVLVCRWETRVQDFTAFAADAGYDATTGVFSFGPDGWKRRGKSWRDPGFAQGPTHPVTAVSWDDAQAFCRWLTARERRDGRLLPGQRYRLPTDSEWSAAVGLLREKGLTPEDRNEKGAAYPWGTGWPPPAGSGNFAASLKVDPAEATTPVGTFKLNHTGLFDLGGNVWEWCEDWYDQTQRNRFLRGGSWAIKGDKQLLSSARYKSPADSRTDDCGFRCVLELAP